MPLKWIFHRWTRIAAAECWVTCLVFPGRLLSAVFFLLGKKMSHLYMTLIMQQWKPLCELFGINLCHSPAWRYFHLSIESGLPVDSDIILRSVHASRWELRWQPCGSSAHLWEDHLTPELCEGAVANTQCLCGAIATFKGAFHGGIKARVTWQGGQVGLNVCSLNFNGHTLWIVRLCAS